MPLSTAVFAFLVALCAGLGARDQSLVMALGRAQGNRPAVLIVALVTAVATIGLAGWVAVRLAPSLALSGRELLAASAFGVAGLTMLVGADRPAPREPTNSLFAVALVLAMLQIADPVRLVVLALSVSAAAPAQVVLGAGAGSTMALCGGWLRPAWLDARGLRWARAATGLFLAGFGIAIAAAHLIA